MQRRNASTLCPRLVYYGARDYADQLDRGDGYHFLQPTAVVAWLSEPSFPKLGFHSIFELRDRYTNARLSEHLGIHVLQLTALSRATATGYAAIVQRWARFFLADPLELVALASEDPIMSIAKQTLEELSQDPVTRRLARDREDAHKLHLMEQAFVRNEGKREANAQTLLKLLRVRFGRVPEATRAQIEAARPEKLDVWLERVLTAKTLEEVFSRQAAVTVDNPTMSTPKQARDEISRDLVIRHRERDRAHKLYLMELAAVRNEGKAEVFLKQLRLRFGPVPEATQAQIEAARPEQLDVWLERVLTAKTLEEVFSP